MRRTMKVSRLGWFLGLMLVATPWRSASGIFLDEDQNISLRARVYSQASVRLENSSVDTVPTTKAGQLVQHRNFYNPELDAKLASYTSWMKGTAVDWLAPDDLSFRFAAWGFYDGIYDYGSSQFDRARRRINSTYNDFQAQPRRAWFLEGPTFNCPVRFLLPGAGQVCAAGIDPNTNRPISYGDIGELYQGHEVQNPRDIYATRRRVNELYLSYSKGPLFVRIGRQSISWGEADTIALLDQNNPFDITLGAPGIFQDLDEARIPLWTLRTSLNLFDTLGPLSSGFVEVYWVPGDLDVNTGILPLLGASPYSPRGNDPQLQVGILPVQFVLFDHIPQKRFENSRWGVRAQTVVNRYFTVSAWYYTHFPNAPVPRALGLAQTTEGPIFTIETVHELTSVIGVANTFFLEPIDSIIRMEVEYFENEPAFIPEENLRITGGPLSLSQLAQIGHVENADFVRWELGADRFFFARALNPTNSFVLITSVVGSWNLDETSLKDFRFAGQRKPGRGGTDPDDFVQLKEVEAFGQVTLQTDYMHGRLSPRVTYVQNVRGTYVLHPSLTYRWTDWLLFGLDLVHIGGEYQQAGFFRDRDQFTARVTYQLN